MADSPPIIELRNVTKTFHETRDGKPVHALKNMSLSIVDRRSEGLGEFVVLLGPSGCGKSTILSLISGLALPDEGEVLVCGERVTGPHPKSATVPQAYTCFPWLTAVQNVEFGLSLHEKDTPKRRRKAEDYMRKVGLGEWFHAYHRHLSGGMQQRVAIARTLVMKRPIVLMDEPFGALDAQTRTDMQQMLLALWQQEKSTIVFVTHDIQEALLLADRVIVFSPRPARILEGGDLTDLSKVFGFDRKPELVNTEKFVEMAAQLRALLKPQPAPEPRSGVSVRLLGFVHRKPVATTPIAGTSPAAETPVPMDSPAVAASVGEGAAALEALEPERPEYLAPETAPPATPPDLGPDLPQPSEPGPAALPPAPMQAPRVEPLPPMDPVRPVRPAQARGAEPPAPAAPVQQPRPADPERAEPLPPVPPVKPAEARAEKAPPPKKKDGPSESRPDLPSATGVERMKAALMDIVFIKGEPPKLPDPPKATPVVAERATPLEATKAAATPAGARAPHAPTPAPKKDPGAGGPAKAKPKAAEGGEKGAGFWAGIGQVLFDNKEKRSK